MDSHAEKTVDGVVVRLKSGELSYSLSTELLNTLISYLLLELNDERNSCLVRRLTTPASVDIQSNKAPLPTYLVTKNPFLSKTFFLSNRAHQEHRFGKRSNEHLRLIDQALSRQENERLEC